MNSQQSLAPRQLVFITGIILTGAGLISVPHELAKIAKIDAWFSELMPAVYSLGIAYFFFILVKWYPGKHLFQIIFELGGKWAGGVMNAVILIVFWLMMLRNIRGLADIVKTTLLRQTPEEIVMLLFMLVIMYYGKLTIETTARVNDFVFPGFLILTMGLPLALSNEFSFERIQPILVEPIVKLYYAGLIDIGWYGDLILIGAFLHTVTVAKQMHSALRLGILLSVLILSMFLLLNIGVLGDNIAARAIFTNYTMIQQIHISEFLDRLEVVVFSLWLPVYVIKVAVLYAAILIGIGSFAGTANPAIFNKSIALFILITSILAFNSLNELFKFANFSSVVFTLCTQLPIILILSVLLIRRWRQAKSKTDQRKQNTSLIGSPHLKGLAGLSYRTWIIISNSLVAGGILTIHIGSLVAKMNPIIANVLALIYFVFLFLIVLSVWMEYKLARNLIHTPSSSDDR